MFRPYFLAIFREIVSFSDVRCLCVNFYSTNCTYIVIIIIIDVIIIIIIIIIIINIKYHNFLIGLWSKHC